MSDERQMTREDAEGVLAQLERNIRGEDLAPIPRTIADALRAMLALHAELERDAAQARSDARGLGRLHRQAVAERDDRDSVLERIEKALSSHCTGDPAADVERVVRERGAHLERGVRLGLEAAAQGLEAFAYIDAPAIVRRLTAAAIIAAAREREAAPAQAVDPLTCGACRDYGHTTPCIGCVERAEQPRAELGETDAGEGE
jgi:hypothetical protein